MLQMSSPQCTQAGEVATAVRTVEGRVFGDASSEASSDTAEDVELPQCKIKRNYNCVKCNYYTQNPRAYLVHLRDIHFERLKIYYCPQCVYASRHHQKLIRHVKMMHGESDTSNLKTEMEPPATTSSAVESLVSAATAKDESNDRLTDAIDMMEPHERIEDMMEEVEDDSPLVAEDFIEEEDVVEVEAENSRSTAEQASTSESRSGRYFSCSKCNYVTHIRSRFTKHVKYHSMPMIKCTMCDFRTPYKWNLDRHMKNHGGTGSFHCSMCNFTADIKQSLTVHEMNHHTPPVNQAVPSVRRRNRVGASDLTDSERPFRIAADDSAYALITKEEEGSGDSRSSFSATDAAVQCLDIEMLSCNSGSNDASERSEAKMEDWQTGNDPHSSNSQPDDGSSQRRSRKLPRPIPQLIPLNASTPNQSKNASSSGEPPLKKIKEMLNNVDETSSINTDGKVEKLSMDISLTSANMQNVTEQRNVKETPTRKKNGSFFDKLKERLLTETGENGSLTCKNCGFESKCLSEHSVHEKNCAPQANRPSVNTSMPSSGSTRCQNCRHRCKSSADLYIHMQTCVKEEVKTELKEHQEVESEVKTDIEELSKVKKEVKSELSTDQMRENQPHPMENVVFVWNNINQDVSDKFERPLDISINDDSTLPDNNRSYDTENNDENLSPTQAIGKKVFKCPHCPFWASTASRFHVHIVGHLNKKPFECSLCKYKSNWRWDITKHIKLKSARNSDHVNAKVLMTDETGRRNYTKYNRFIAIPLLNEAGENEFVYIDQDAAAMDESMEGDELVNDTNEGTSTLHEMPLDLQTQNNDNKPDNDNEAKKVKKTLWKCKKCNYKDPSKEALLEHVREHSMMHQDGTLDDSKSLSKKPEASKDPADLAYRCGHCLQLSNWKHVIQRHCRLKHEGVIKVVAIEKPKQDSQSFNDNSDICPKCPFRTNDKQILKTHMQAHSPTSQSIFKCFFCPYFVKNENELPEHLVVHGVTDPEAYFAKVMALRAMNSQTDVQNKNAEQQQTSAQTNGQATTSQTAGPASGQTSGPPTKRHKCIECPYETNSKSQYMYHEQFHRMNADTPYKCQECNYSVSKRHLLHQHMRVHGIFPKKNDAESEFEASTSQANAANVQTEYSMEPDDIPFVWVAAKNEFHKMYKCRYCSYVNSQKCKIPNHEKIHCVNFENSLVKVYKCLECKFTCNNSGRLAEHSKSHGEIYGRIYCAVHPDIPDDEQISNLRKLIEEEKTTFSEDGTKDGSHKDEGKLLHFCQKCPARFFTESELKIHDNFHNLTFSFKCKSCEFSVPVESQLSAHVFVHSDDYRAKTKMLRMMHATHPDHDEPPLELLHSPATSAMTWVVTPDNKVSESTGRSANKSSTETKNTPKQYMCKECPAKFFKTSTLNYHMGLHGGEGEHKCRSCSYAVKNTGHLAKHELLHENEGKTPTREYDSGDDMDYKNIPLSGTDLFQRKTEAQKRVLIDKDKLVRPNDHFPPVLQADPQFGYLMHGNPEFIYPTYLKNGRQKEKRYKCHKCPSAFEKREQYKIHLSLHGSKQRYKCELCDYSVKYYANYVQHMRKHQMNDEAQAERRKGSGETAENETLENTTEDSIDDVKLAIKTMPKPALVKSDFQQFSLCDQQTLRLLQRKRSMTANAIEAITPETPTSNRKMHLCSLCPYSNQRHDALENHYRRHDLEDVINAGYQRCPFCDVVIAQSHFLRDHVKTHFNYQKNLTAQCYSTSEDVTFTIERLDEDNVTDTLNMEIDVKVTKCSDDKIVVQISTGEVVINSGV